MSGLSRYGENLALDILLGQNQSSPGTVYIALLKSEPADTDSGSTIDEVSGGSYARVAVTNNSTNWPAASTGSKSNGTGISFPTATADWGTVTHFAITTASSGGSVIGWGRLQSGGPINSGTTPRFDSGNLTIVAD